MGNLRGLAYVLFVDTDEGILTLPFCGSNGLCDPGYVNLTYTKTEADREELRRHGVYLTPRIGIQDLRLIRLGVIHALGARSLLDRS